MSIPSISENDELEIVREDDNRQSEASNSSHQDDEVAQPSDGATFDTAVHFRLFRTYMDKKLSALQASFQQQPKAKGTGRGIAATHRR